MHGRKVLDDAWPAAWWQRLRQRWWQRRVPDLRLHPAGVPASDLAGLQPLLADIAAERGLRLVICSGPDCDAALLDLATATGAGRDEVRARTAGLPAILYERPAATPIGWHMQRAELARQLLALPALRRRDAANAPLPAAGDTASVLSTVFDDDDEGNAAGAGPGLVPDAAQRDLVGCVLQGLRDAKRPPLHASYGPQAHLRADFEAARVWLDPLALRALRIGRLLPRCDAAALPGAQAQLLALDSFAWELGLACGPYVLLDEPADPWRVALVGLAADRVERYSRQPRHLELARRLHKGPATPAALCRHVRIDAAELRRFVQACLFLGLVRWQLDDDTPGLDKR